MQVYIYVYIRALQQKQYIQVQLQSNRIRSGKYASLINRPAVYSKIVYQYKTNNFPEIFVLAFQKHLMSPFQMYRKTF